MFRPGFWEVQKRAEVRIQNCITQCCGSGIRCLFDPGIRNRFFPDPGSQIHIFESLVTIFWVKSSIILWKLAEIFFFSTKIICNFVKFVATWKVMTTNFFSPLSFVAVFGSGMGKNQDPGSGINIPDPQHWYTGYHWKVFFLIYVALYDIQVRLSVNDLRVTKIGALKLSLLMN